LRSELRDLFTVYQSAGPPDPLAHGARMGHAGADAFSDQFAFKLRERPYDVKHQLAGGRGGIDSF
jgi:hypothetical protein